MRKLICIITVCFMIITMFSGCAVLEKLGLQNDEKTHPVSSIAMGEDETKRLTDQVPIHLYFANEDSTKLALEVRYIPVSEAKKSVNTLAATIVKELIKGPKAGSALKPTIPAGTQLRSPISINAFVATVDFTKEFVDKHPGGKAAEQLTIYSIVNSLTEIKDIQKVKFTINGKVQNEYKGNFQFNVPFPRSASLISKVVPTPAPAKEKEDANKQDGDKKSTSTPQKSTPKVTPKPAASIDNTDGDTDISASSSEEDSESAYSEILE